MNGLLTALKGVQGFDPAKSDTDVADEDEVADSYAAEQENVTKAPTKKKPHTNP